jgi:hypothetical protein
MSRGLLLMRSFLPLTLLKAEYSLCDGPGGAGKTYLYKALLMKIRSQNKIVVATATSGVAASILPGGRTAHSHFKIPLTIVDGTFCSFTKQSDTAKLLQTTSLI